MESPFYWTIPVEERILLLKGLMNKYTTLLKGTPPYKKAQGFPGPGSHFPLSLPETFSVVHLSFQQKTVLTQGDCKKYFLLKAGWKGCYRNNSLNVKC
jgi:hypothetical protein